MKVRANREMFYMSRRLKAGDEFEATSIDARFLLGDESVEEVVEPPRRPHTSRAVHTESASSESVDKPETSLSEMTHSQLAELASERGIELPEGYVRKDKLIELLGG